MIGNGSASDGLHKEAIQASRQVPTALNAQVSGTETPSLETLIMALSQCLNPTEREELVKLVSQQILQDTDKFTELLLKITKNIKTQKIKVSQGRNVAIAVCHILGEYVASHQYEKGEEENFRIVLQLFGNLVLGATKIPLYPQEQPQNIPQPIFPQAEFKSPQNFQSKAITEPPVVELEKSPTEPTVTPPQPSEKSPPSSPELPVSKIPKVPDEKNNSFVAFATIEYLFHQKRINPEDLLEIANIYGKSWKEISQESLKRYEQFINAIIAAELKLSMEVRDGLFAIKKLGFREVICLAEGQYRQNQYIESKVKPILSQLQLEEEPTEENLSQQSPLEVISGTLLRLYLKIKDSASGTKSINVKYEEDLPTYLMQKTGHTYDAQLTILFTAVYRMYMDGLLYNVKTRHVLEHNGQFGKTAQVLYEELNQTWQKRLSQVAKLCVNIQNITAFNGQKIKKLLLDYPLKNFFIESERRGGITQTISQQEVAKIPLEDCANLIILLHCSIQGVENPLGQIKNLYFSVWERLMANEQTKAYSYTYLMDRGYPKHQARQILESNELIMLMQWDSRAIQESDNLKNQD